MFLAWDKSKCELHYCFVYNLNTYLEDVVYCIFSEPVFWQWSCLHEIRCGTFHIRSPVGTPYVENFRLCVETQSVLLLCIISPKVTRSQKLSITECRVLLHIWQEPRKHYYLQTKDIIGYISEKTHIQCLGFRWKILQPSFLNTNEQYGIDLEIQTLVNLLHT